MRVIGALPAKLPESEPDGFAGAVLTGGAARRSLSGVPELLWLGTYVIGTAAAVVAVLIGSAWLAIAGFVLAAIADWAGDTVHGQLWALIRFAGWGAPLGSLLRWLLLIAALGGPSPLALVPLALQVAALSGATAARWLQQRQPPLLFEVGAATQPETTTSYARAYHRASTWPGALLLIEVATALATRLGGYWALAAVPICLGFAVFWLTDAVRLSRRAPAIQQRLCDALLQAAPRCMVHVSGGIGQARYLYNQWVGAFDALPTAPLVVVREASQLPVMSPARGTVVYAPSSRHVEAVCVPSVTVAFYLANGQKNGDLWRNSQLTHVFLGHGDSDKATSASPIARIYDELWVAGEAAVDRYRAAGIGIPGAAFVVVGRPQVDPLPVGPTANQRPVLLYAPTFEGYAEATNYSSLGVLGEALIEWLLQHRPDVTVWFRPHPSTGVQRPDLRAVRERLNERLRKAGAPHRALDDWPAETLTESMIGADVLVTDVSSVSSDYLQTERPMIVTDPAGLGGPLFRRTFPSQAASYLLGPQLDELAGVLDDCLGDDPLRPERIALKRHILGNLPHGPIAAFVAATERLTQTN